MCVMLCAKPSQAFKYAKPLGLVTHLLHLVGNSKRDQPDVVGVECVRVGDNEEVLTAKMDSIEGQHWVLDAGSGSGSGSCAARLMPGCLNILAYDNNPKMVEWTTQRIGKALCDLEKELAEECLTGEEKRERGDTAGDVHEPQKKKKKKKQRREHERDDEDEDEKEKKKKKQKFNDEGVEVKEKKKKKRTSVDELNE